MMSSSSTVLIVILFLSHPRHHPYGFYHLIIHSPSLTHRIFRSPLRQLLNCKIELLQMRTAIDMNFGLQASSSLSDFTSVNYFIFYLRYLGLGQHHEEKMNTPPKFNRLFVMAPAVKEFKQTICSTKYKHKQTTVSFISENLSNIKHTK